MAVNLEKQVEKIGIILEKKNINNIPCQVKLAIDRSGSMDDLYRSGVVQKVVERITALALKFDKDGTLDLWAFNTRSFPIKSVTQPLTESFVREEIERKVSAGGTSYEPSMSDILNSSKGSKGFLGFGKKEADPTLAIFITDGENDDPYQAEKVMVQSQDKNIYWLLVGIGTSSFNFISEMGDKYPNVGFIPIKNISNISDDDLYEGLLNDELAEWFKKFKKV